jgi:hypothetical protein
MLTFLHTSPVHIATFDALLAEHGLNTPVRHIVAESLLAEAIATGITPILRDKVAQIVTDGVGEDGILICTCSTLGGIAEEAHPRALRVDRPMAERAVASGNRIVVMATVTSTLDPTRELLLDVVKNAGIPLNKTTISTHFCQSAWAHFEAGNLSAYHQAIANDIPHLATQADVIVLAQASMTPAADLCPDVSIPILSSPRLAVERLVSKLVG